MPKKSNPRITKVPISPEAEALERAARCSKRVNAILAEENCGVQILLPLRWWDRLRKRKIRPLNITPGTRVEIIPRIW